MAFLTVRAKAFSGEGVREHSIMVTGGCVFVFDAVAKHYTTCHALSAAALRRIKKKAARLSACEPCHPAREGPA